LQSLYMKRSFLRFLRNCGGICNCLFIQPIKVTVNEKYDKKRSGYESFSLRFFCEEYQADSFRPETQIVLIAAARFALLSQRFRANISTMGTTEITAAMRKVAVAEP